MTRLSGLTALATVLTLLGSVAMAGSFQDRTIVGSGENTAGRWQVFAFRDRSEGDSRLCVGMTLRRGSAWTCGAPIRRGEIVGLISEGRVCGRHPVGEIAGATTSAVAKVEIRFKHRKPRTARIFDAPAGLNYEGRFFGRALKGDFKVTSVRALDTEGHVLRVLRDGFPNCREQAAFDEA